MKLNAMLREIGIPPVPTDAEVVNVTDDIAGVVQNSLFVCIRGSRTDGHRFAGAAVKAGACAVVSQTPLDLPQAVCVPDTRLAFSRLCAAFYGRPDRRLTLVGVTGTNGKTTTAAYLRHILEKNGRKTALIGTLGVDDGTALTGTGYTTPPGDVFFRTLADAAAHGCVCCVSEVSSQALAQKRVHGARFRLGIFTNLGRDHLDYHGSMACLAEAKASLGTLCEKMLINADDAYADVILEKSAVSFLYSCRGRGSDFAARRLRQEKEHTYFEFCCPGAVFPVRTPVPGVYAVYNALSALSAAVLLGVTPRDAAAAAEDLPVLPGRGELILKNGVRVCIDFAHTQAALSAILSALRPGTEGRLLTVFGCGGDRDRSKRPYMGEAAASLSDAVILTSDNPRSEDPETIIAEIRAGIRSRTPVFSEPDREKAIRLALSKARPGDTVLIAGKGHETTQRIGETEIPFSDRAVVEEY